MMKRYTLCYYSATAAEIPSMSEGARLYQAGGGRITVHARTQVQLFDRARQQDFIRKAMAADALIVSLHGDRASFPAFDLLEQALKDAGGRRPFIHIQPADGDEDSIEAAREFSTDFGSPGWDMMKRYLNFGGHLNFQHMMIFLHNRLSGGNMECRPPEALPDDGIYHPDFPGVPDLEEYLSRNVDPSRITVGL